MNTPKRTSRKLDMDRAGVKDVEAAPKQALKEFGLAVALNPKYKQAHMNLGKILIQLNRAPEALGPLATALALPPDSAPACNYMGIALLKSGHIDKSIVYFRKALALKPNFASARKNLNAALAAQQKRP